MLIETRACLVRRAVAGSGGALDAVGRTGAGRGCAQLRTVRCLDRCAVSGRSARVMGRLGPLIAPARAPIRLPPAEPQAGPARGEVPGSRKAASLLGLSQQRPVQRDSRLWILRRDELRRRECRNAREGAVCDHVVLPAKRHLGTLAVPPAHARHHLTRCQTTVFGGSHPLGRHARVSPRGRRRCGGAGPSPSNTSAAAAACRWIPWHRRKRPLMQAEIDDLTARRRRPARRIRTGRSPTLTTRGAPRLGKRSTTRQRNTARRPRDGA